MHTGYKQNLHCFAVTCAFKHIYMFKRGIVMKEKEKKKKDGAEAEKDPNQKEYSLISNMVYILKGTFRFQTFQFHEPLCGFFSVLTEQFALRRMSSSTA